MTTTEQGELCNCGSGKERFALVDAAGIFCRYVCDDCEEQQRARYNPAIFALGTRYAMTGEEADIWAEIRSYDNES